MLKLKAAPAPGWPAGVYFHGDDLFRMGIIAADELPRERSTLLVRIMAAGRLLPEAIADLAALPDDAHERTVAEQILIHLREALRKKLTPSPEEEEFIVRMQGTWADARRLGRDEGEAIARARAVLTVLRVRGIAVPDSARQRILTETDATRLELWHERAILAASITDVIDTPS